MDTDILSSDMMTFFPPGLMLIIAGLFLPFTTRFTRLFVLAMIPLWALWEIWQIPTDPTLSTRIIDIAGIQLIPVAVHTYSHIFATVFSIALLGGIVFAYRHAKTAELAAAFMYAGGAIGVTFAGDFISLFLYWELMAIGSTIVVWSGQTKESAHAGMRYMYMHFLGGVILLCGITAHIVFSQSSVLVPFTVNIEDWLSPNVTDIAAWAILLGVLINAAAPPFSAWLSDSYPESSISGSVFLSAFTTKTSVFVLITLFAGNSVLIWIGLLMTVYGIVYAILENDMRRILAYSIINQVGFMITGIGIGTQMALYGAATHAFCHIIYKALLLMSAGSVLLMTGKRKCTELGGLYHSMKLTAICGIIGALSISAFPLTSGFVSKSMIATAAANKGLVFTWFILAGASAGVFLHAGIKFPWFVFFQKDSGMRPKEPPLNMRVAMVIFSALCIGLGMFPQWLYSLLPTMPDYVPYTAEHVVTQLQLLLFSGLAFFLMLPLLKRTKTISLDVDWFYRRFFANLLQLIDRLRENIAAIFGQSVRASYSYIVEFIQRYHGMDGVLARGFAIGSTVLWATTLLGLYLLLFYL